MNYLKQIVFDINKILINGCKATLKKRVPADLKDDGVLILIQVKGAKGRYNWGIYPDKEYLLNEWWGSLDVKNINNIEKNPEGYAEIKFVEDVLKKYGYKKTEYEY